MLNILYEPKNNQYRNLLDFCLKYSNKFIIVNRKTMKLSKNYHNIINILEPFLIRKYKSNEWPGTKLIGNKATIYLLHYNVETITIIKKYTNRLFDWKYPNLPEDICFLDKNENVILATISHENDAFINTNIEIEKDFIIFFNKEGIKYEVVKNNE